jgi:hypothetical protein
MNKVLLGIVLGCIAGIIDVIPMILQKLTWDANASAFCLWVVAGFMIATSSLQIHPVLKGIIISFLILLPSLILIASKDIKSIVPIIIMTLILGSALGFSIGKLAK